MQLTGVTAVTDQGNMQDYVTGEGMEWMLAFQVCGINLNMFHIGQLSDELNTLLVERFGEEVLTNPGNVEFYWLSIEPMDIPQGMPLARPQVTFSFSDEVDGETYYYAHAQMEWTANDSFACDDISGYCGTCAYAMFSEEDQNDLQGALDRNLIEPISYGRFLKYNPSTGDPASIFAAAHSELCAVDSFVLENTPETMATLFDNNSYSWLDKPMSTHARDYFAIYEIKKGGAAYEEVREYYTNDDVSYMIVRDIVDDTTGLPSGYFGAFGEVLSITDDGGEGTFIVRTRNENTLPESDMSQYFAARYRLESDKLLVHWGESSFFQDDVVVPEPEPIPQSVTCNGEPTFCYDHDFSEFYN